MTEEKLNEAINIQNKMKDYEHLIDAIELSGNFDIHFHFVKDGMNREFRLSYLHDEIEALNIRRILKQYAELRLEETQKEFDEL